MLTSVQVSHARRFTTSPRSGFSIPEVDQLVAQVATTLASYEGTGGPGPDGLTAATLSNVVLPSVHTKAGYDMLQVQDFLDEVHDTLATFEQRGAFPPQPAPATSWTPVPYSPPRAAPTASAPAASDVPDRRSERSVANVPLPTNMGPAIRALATVGAPRTSERPPMSAPARPAPTSVAPRQASAPLPVSAPARDYGMDADALVFELQSAIAQSRARGSLRVVVQAPGQQLRVMRIVESAPGSITIVAQ